MARTKGAKSRTIRITSKGYAELIMQHRKHCKKCAGLLIGCVKGMTLKHDFDNALRREMKRKENAAT